MLMPLSPNRRSGRITAIPEVWPPAGSRGDLAHSKLPHRVQSNPDPAEWPGRSVSATNSLQEYEPLCSNENWRLRVKISREFYFKSKKAA
jgi:hypothetical protein